MQTGFTEILKQSGSCKQLIPPILRREIKIMENLLMKIKTKITLGFVLIIFSILFSCKHEIPDNKKVLKTYYVQDDTYGVWTFYDDGCGTYSTQKNPFHQ